MSNDKKRSKLGMMVAAGVDALAGGLYRDFLGCRQIVAQPERLPESTIPMRRFRDLVVQGCRPDGRIWATRGYHLYEWTPQQPDSFRIISHLSCPANKAWFGHLRAAREYLHRCDILDVVPLASGAVLVFSGGYIYRAEAPGGPYRRVHRLRFWGPGIGRGVRPLSMTQLPSGRILYGEYTANPDDAPVHLYSSDDDGRSWRLFTELPAGNTRHIHALQWDPFARRLWLCTGDANDKSYIAWSNDEGRTFESIGTGSQQWRVCKLQFTESHVYWGTDTNDPALRGVFRWNRLDQTCEHIVSFGGPVLSSTRLAGGLWAMGTDREGLSGMRWAFGEDPSRYHVTEWDEIPSLWISPDASNWKRMPLKQWMPQARPAFGIPQFAVGDKCPFLAVTCINMIEWNNDLLLIEEQRLRNWHEQAGVGTDY